VPSSFSHFGQLPMSASNSQTFCLGALMTLESYETASPDKLGVRPKENNSLRVVIRPLERYK
jgi:hypothetical protein